MSTKKAHKAILRCGHNWQVYEHLIDSYDLETEERESVFLKIVGCDFKVEDSGQKIVIVKVPIAMAEEIGLVK